MNLKHLLLAAAACVVAAPALAADVSWPDPAPVPPTPAQRMAMGYAELSYGWYSDDDYLLGKENDFNVIAAAGLANIPIGQMWNFELEARGSSYYAPGASSVLSEVGGYGHAYWRDPAKWAAGVFGGYTTLSSYGDAVDKWLVGAEGQAYWNALTLYVQGGYINLSGQYIDGDGFFARGAVRYFVTPNFRLQGDVQWAALDLGYTDVDDLALVGTAEYRLANVPLSAFASYRWDSVGNDYFDGDASTITIGIRGYLGSGSLLDNDRNGATMDVLPVLFSAPK